ncbi:MAG: AAA family ATPase [Methylococcaceae bacterium]|nr:AAA family ATPase [Methylococcaceae bacterium]
MNDAFFKSVHISNFKSLKDVTLKDCKRINLLIGKPNVGKSNILEAIGLFSLPHIKYNKNKKITQFIRLENISELFSDGNINTDITISVNDDNFCTVKYYSDKFFNKPHFKLRQKNGDFKYTPLSEDTDCSFIHQQKDGEFADFRINNSSKNTYIQLNNLLNLANLENHNLSKVKYYKFAPQFFTKKQNRSPSFLIPSVGNNLLEAIQKNGIDKELSTIFDEYGLKLMFDKTNQTLRIMKILEDNAIVSFPYGSIADTLQRMIFFKTAIASNEDSILLFEEPEAHCFPPYIAHFTQDVINSENNQFFIATHSPYVLNDFLETKETRNELAIFFADFKDGQTVINRLTDEELEEIYDYGIDVFFNYERFTQHG